MNIVMGVDVITLSIVFLQLLCSNYRANVVKDESHIQAGKKKEDNIFNFYRLEVTSEYL